MTARCSKCGKTFAFSYGQTIEDLNKIILEHQTHLCSVCPKEFPTCKAKNITFGECVGRDNVIACDIYTEAKIEDLIEEYRYNLDEISLPAITKEIIKLAKEVTNASI